MSPDSNTDQGEIVSAQVQCSSCAPETASTAQPPTNTPISTQVDGIAGIVGSAVNPLTANSTQKMVARMCHNNGDITGYALYAGLGASLGWVYSRRMAASSGPSWSQSRHVAVILSGEEFSFNESRGPSRTAAALAEAFEKVGTAAFGELNGWFSGVVIDTRRAAVTLFNDRFGRGRVYYHEAPQSFFFASEAKSILAVRPQLRKLDPQGVAEMFAVGCVMQNRSLFTGISLLPPGSAWTFHRNGHVEKATYFNVGTWEQQSVLRAPEYIARLRDVFAQIGRRYLQGGHQVAISLTGGLDSRAVMAWIKNPSAAIPCYTFGGPYRDCSDVLIARQIAALCECPHTTIRVLDSFYSNFADLAEKVVYLTDGTMDVSGAVELHVNQQAREHAPVRLTGNYGSEVLRSHVALRPQPIDTSLLEPEFAKLVEEANRTYAQEISGNPLSFILLKQVPWHHYARFAVEKSQLMPRSPFLDNEIVSLAFRTPPELRCSVRPLLQLIAGGNRLLANISTDRGYRLNTIPFFSTAASTWRAFTARAEYAYDYGMPHWLAKVDGKLAALHLERIFLGRHKFYHFRIWYRDQLRPYVRAHSGGRSIEDLFYRRGAAARIGEEHLSGRRNRTLELHRLFTLQLVDRLLVRAP